MISLLEKSTLGFIAALPQLAAAAGCIKRLEDFISEVRSVKKASLDVTLDLHMNGSTEDDEKPEDSARSGPKMKLFSLLNANLKTTTDSNSFCLRSVNLDIYPGQLVGITGPAGAGKTTLIKALLNRLPDIDEQTMQRPNRLVMYCAQTPWLPSGTIRETIIGEAELDEIWYAKILEACSLHQDLKTMNMGEETNVGSQGTNLSGGQKQRVVSSLPL